MTRSNWITYYSLNPQRQPRFDESEGHWLEKQQRHECTMKHIDRGVGFSELASLISETWGCTRRNARHVVSLAHKEWMEIAFGAEELDQRDLLFQSVTRLERTARKAEESGQFAVVVGCVAQLKQDDGSRC